MKKFNLRIIFEIIILILLIIISIRLINNNDNDDIEIINNAFSLEDEDSNLKYNTIASSLSEIGYELMMISDEGLYSVDGAIENDNFSFETFITIDSYGNIIENTIKIKTNNLPSDENFNEIYSIFSQTLNIYGKDINIDNFYEILLNSEEYNEMLHGMYESSNGIYEIYKEDGINYIIYKEKAEDSAFSHFHNSQSFV